MEVNNVSISDNLKDNVSVEKESSDVRSEVLPSVDSDRKDSCLRGSLLKFRERIQKRKRPRRKSKKGKYPYNKLTWQERKQRENNASERAQRVRQEMFAHGQPVAPYNTTQFLIEDHGNVHDIDAQLQVAQDQGPGGSIVNNKTSRARDSSFSIDSDEDYFYSSPEDEEEFLTKEFSNAYEDLHVERLSMMSKLEIIHDFIQLETKYEKSLTEIRRLKRFCGERQDEENAPLGEEGARRDEGDVDTDTSSKSESELSEQLRISQLENKTLRLELEEVRRENKKLHSLVDKNHSTSSSSSSSSVDSDSDSSSTMSDSSSSSDDEVDMAGVNHIECEESEKRTETHSDSVERSFIEQTCVDNSITEQKDIEENMEVTSVEPLVKGRTVVEDSVTQQTESEVLSFEQTDERPLNGLRNEENGNITEFDK